MKSTKLSIFFLTALFLFQVLGLIESKTKLRNNSNSMTNQNQKAKVYLEAVIDGEKKCLYSISTNPVFNNRCEKTKYAQWDIEYNSNTRKIKIQSFNGNYLNFLGYDLVLREDKYEWEFTLGSNGNYLLGMDLSKSRWNGINFKKDLSSNYWGTLIYMNSLEFNIFSVSDNVRTKIQL
jgi:hypothetical protein